MRFVSVWFVFFLASGCASSPVQLRDYSTTTSIDTQRIGEVRTRAAGDVLVSKGIRTTWPALRIARPTTFNKAQGESSIITCAFTALAGTYPQRGVFKGPPPEAKCFGPVTVHMTLSDGTTNWNCPGQSTLADICLDAAGNYFVGPNPLRGNLKQQFENVQSINIAVDGQPNLVQELMYDGRSGDRLNFTYREFTSDFDHPSYAQGFQHYVYESSIVAFRSLRFEVIDAEATSITYKIVSGFDGR
jgi:hypothetical protein